MISDFLRFIDSETGTELMFTKDLIGDRWMCSVDRGPVGELWIPDWMKGGHEPVPLKTIGYQLLKDVIQKRAIQQLTTSGVDGIQPEEWVGAA